MLMNGKKWFHFDQMDLIPVFVNVSFGQYISYFDRYLKTLLREGTFIQDPKKIAQ